MIKVCDQLNGFKMRDSIINDIILKLKIFPILQIKKNFDFGKFA